MCARLLSPSYCWIISVFLGEDGVFVQPLVIERQGDGDDWRHPSSLYYGF